jgi:tetratricopeptide (TPR) repeat protein
MSKLFYSLLILFTTLQVLSQDWNHLETEYNNLLKNKQNDLALKKAKEMNSWALVNQGDSSVKYAVSLRYLGDCFYSLLEADSAIIYFKYSLDALTKQNRNALSDFVLNLYNLGDLYYNMGNYNAAKPYFMEVSEIYEKTFGEDHPNFAFILEILGNLYSDIGDYKIAELYYKQSLKINKKALGEEHPNVAMNLNNLGNLYSDIGDYKIAELYYKQSLKINTIALGEEHTNVAVNLGNLGVLFSDMGDYKSAELYYNQSLKIYKKALGENDPNVAVCLNNLGVLYSDIGDYKTAELYYKQSLNLYKKALGGEHTNVAKSAGNLGDLYSHMGNDTKAMQYYMQAFEIIKKALGEEHPDFARILVSIGNNFAIYGNYKVAEQLYKNALEISKKALGDEHPQFAKTLNNLGDLYSKMGNYKAAEQYYKNASEISKKALGDGHPEFATTLNKLGGLYSDMGNYKAAEQYYKQALKINTQILSQNFSWLSTIEKEAYWQKEIYFYYGLELFALKANTTFPTFTNYSYKFNLIKKSILLENSRDIEKTIMQTKNESIKLQFNEMKNLRRLYSKMQSAGSDKKELMERYNKQADSLDKILANKVGEYAAFKRNFELTWEDVKLGMTSDEAAIEFEDYYDEKDSIIHYMALVVKKGSKNPQLIKLCSENELKQYSPETELYTLYDLIWKPLLPSLTNVNTIYYSPSGLLNNIPFQALYKEENGQRAYVMDKFKLHQLTSTRYLALGLKQKEQELIETSIALFGGINYNDYPNAVIDTLNSEESSEAAFLYKNAIVLNRELDSTRTGASYLPGTKKEVETIYDVLKSKQWQVDISEGKNATENKIKSLSGKSSKSILHVATHGFAYPDKEEKRKDLAFSMMSVNDKYKASDNPMIRSGLLFGGANMTWQGKGDSLLNTTNEDGVLTAYELSQLDLSKTKLAVLSACETGKGAIQGSEGTFGLKRALKLAGVDNMIVSLWKVPDDATMEMMTLFYTELAKSKLPVQAFELAQKTMRNKYPNELKKWAGFVFVR